jgi:hypothetical protein
MGCRRRLTAGDYRWLLEGPPGQEDLAVVLNAIPDPPVMDEETAEQIEAVLAKGWLGSVFLQTDDLRASYEELKARGVEFTRGARGASPTGSTRASATPRATRSGWPR